MNTVIWISRIVLAVAAVLCMIRLLRGGSLADRIIALDSLLIVLVVGIGVDAAATGRDTYLGVMLIVALIAFIGTTTVARFIERRGAR